MLEDKEGRWERRSLRALKEKRSYTRRVDKVFHGLHSEQHLIRRARERYRLDLTPADLAIITRLANRSTSVVNEEDGRRICRVTYRGTTLWVLHLPKSGVIKTFLPPGAKRLSPRGK